MLAAVAHFQQGMFYQTLKQPRIAEQSFRKSLAITQAQLGPDHPYNCLILHALGNLLEG